ncbi:hypothetical protein PAE9249_03805 [Paenibacillus sp. CECT 9249]|nr:hypothetical protein PAE9249_03805 [Paenibacillus sp. CECT 9249]
MSVRKNVLLIEMELTLMTRVGNLTLHVPVFIDGKFSTELFARYQRGEQALVLAMRGVPFVIVGALYTKAREDG